MVNRLATTGPPLLFYYTLIFGVISIMVYKDAKKNSNGSEALWSLLTFLIPLLGILLYFLVGRDKEESSTGKALNCAECGTEVNTTEDFCSSCGTQLKVLECSECGNEVDATAEFCSGCGTEIDDNVTEQKRNIKNQLSSWTKFRKVAAAGTVFFLLSMFLPYAEVPRISPVSMGTTDVAITVGERFANAPFVFLLYLPLLFPLLVWDNRYKILTTLSALIIALDIFVNLGKGVFLGYYVMSMGGILAIAGSVGDIIYGDSSR